MLPQSEVQKNVYTKKTGAVGHDDQKVSVMGFIWLKKIEEYALFDQMYYYAGSVCDFYLALLVANDCLSEVFYPLKILLYPLFFCCLWTVKPAVEIQ